MGYENGHLIVSVAGWNCDVCGVEVNGQTDESGRPTINGDSVRHTPPDLASTCDRCGAPIWYDAADPNNYAMRVCSACAVDLEVS